MDVSGEFDTVTRRVECLESRSRLRVLFNTRAHVGCERLSDRACQRRCSLEPGADLDAISLTLSACAPVEPVCRELIATVLYVRACGIDEAGATHAFKTRRVSQQFRLRGTTQQQSRKRVARGKDTLMQAIKSTRTRDGNARNEGCHDETHTDQNDGPRRDVNHRRYSSSSRPRIRSRARLEPESAGLPMVIASL